MNVPPNLLRLDTLIIDNKAKIRYLKSRRKKIICTKMSTLKDVSIIVKWNGKEFPITDLSDQETVAVLKHEIAKLTNVRPERQKLLNLKYKGNNGLT